ncbi:MAG: hypothetical protein EOO09_14145 [Chitinophagaceae bacterium]|nr:MAG: hypothetical protein EOO09_14145 [Chitinophagaceae bacterium]
MKLLFCAFLVSLSIAVSAQSDLLWKDGHGSTINQVSFSPDGKYFVSVEKDTLAIVWEISSGQQLRTIQHVEAAKFRDNNSIYLAMTDKTFRLVNLEGEIINRFSQKKKIYTFGGPYFEELQRQIFPESGLYLYGGDVFDIDKGYRHHVGDGNYTPARAYTSDGRISASMTADNAIVSIEDAVTGLTLFHPSTAIVNQGHPDLLFSPDNKYLRVFRDRMMQVIEVSTGKIILTHQEKAARLHVEKAAFIPGTTTMVLVTKSYDTWVMTVKGIDYLTGKVLWSLPLPESSVAVAVQPTPDGSSVLVWTKGDEQEIIQSYKPATGSRNWSVKHADIHTAMSKMFISFTADGRQFLLGTERTLKLWSASDGKVLKDFSRKFPGTSTNVSFAGTTQMSALVDNYLYTWNLQTGAMNGRVPRLYKGEKRENTDLKVAGSRIFKLLGNKLMEVDSAGKMIYQYKSARPLGVCFSLQVSYDGAYVMYAGYDEKSACKDWNVLLQVFDTKTRLPVLVKSCMADRNQAFASTSNKLVFQDIAKKGTLSVYDLPAKKLLYDLAVPGMSEYGGVPVFSPKDNFIVVDGERQEGKPAAVIVDLQARTSFLVNVTEPDLIATKSYGLAKQVGFTPDEKYLLLQNNATGFTGAFDIKERRFDRSLTHRAPGTNKIYPSIVVAPMGNMVFYSSYEQVIYIWDLLKKKVTGTIYPSPGENQWAVISPDGSFDANEAAQGNMFYNTGGSVSPLSAMYEQFYKPRLLPRILDGEGFEPSNVDVNKLRKAPVVKLGFKENTRNLEVEDESVQKITASSSSATVTINASCPLDGVTEIRLYQNGKLVETTRGLEIGEDDAAAKNLSKSFAVGLVEGKNFFRAIALNTQRTESKPVELEVSYKADKPAQVSAANGVELHLVIVGINQYKNPKYNLNYAQADADAFRESVTAGASTIFSRVNTHFVQDADASKAGISAALDKVKAGSKAEDVFIFYYAGHGVMNDKKEFYLVPSDVTQLYGNDDALAQKGISSASLQDYSKNIKAQKQLFILDACQSAAALENIVAARGAAEEKAIAQLARSTGTHWLVASGSMQFASEFGKLGHGAFTWCLLEGLKGAADNGDRKITVKELDSYLQGKVPEITEKYRGAIQYPASYGYGNDFPFVIVK